MGLHLTVFGAANVIGPAAVPSDTTNASGNYGTIATCTAQGVIIYITSMTAVWYYVSISIYSYLGTLSNFQESVLSVEKYLHVLVHIYPIASGIYLATIKVFNNSGLGYCFLEMDPIGCGIGNPMATEYVKCSRGFDSYTQFQTIELFWDIALYLEMIVPTLIMCALYFQVRLNQSRTQIPAIEVVKQAAVYLAALFIGIFPSAVVHTMEWGGTFNVSSQVFSQFMFMLFGLFTFSIYLYFSTGDWEVEIDDENRLEDGGGESIFGNFESSRFKLDKVDPADASEHPSEARDSVGDLDVSKRHRQSLVSSRGSGHSRQGSGHSRGRSGHRRGSVSRRSSGRPRFSFNIFDGTNASGIFADFIHDGDSEDIRLDQASTDKWAACQDHI